MKPPSCKLCGERHWLDEGHRAGLEAVRELGACVLRNTKPPNAVPVTLNRQGIELAKGWFEKEAVAAEVAVRVLAPAIEELANKRTEPLNGRNKRTRGRPRKWASEAERKRAYRGRSK